MSDKSILDKLSEERKAGIEEGTIPPWFTTPAYQLFKGKYVYEGSTIRDTYQRIANAAARYTKDPAHWGDKFFQVMWKGWLALSSPVLANMGTERGLPVSCSGNYVATASIASMTVNLRRLY